MSGKHLCQSRLSATYISSNRYMHIILFYFRLFILFSPGLPFIGLSSFFIRPSFSLSTVLSLLPLRHSGSLPHHFLCSPPSFQLSSPSFPARPGIPVLSTVLPLIFPTGFSPSFPMFTLSVIPFALPRDSSSRLRHSRLDRESLCHPEPVLLVTLSASEGSSPTDFSIIISKHTKI